MSLHTDNQTKNTQGHKQSFLVKVGLGAFMCAAMVGTSLGFHTPTTHAASDASSAASVIHQVFGRYADQAMHIAQCESSLNPGATNTEAIGGSHAAGLFQVLYPSTWKTTSQAGASPYNMKANAIAAHEIFARDGNSWREWQCKP